MFDALKKNRSLIMGLAILWVAFYHIPWIDRNPILDFIHDTGYMGVDVFLEHLGEASSEALMLHVGIYKLIQQRWHLYPKQWMLVLLGCMLLAVLYHGLLKKLKK